MPSIDNDDDVFGSRYLAPTSGGPRKSASSLSLNGRKSSTSPSLRGSSSLADALGDDVNGRHSLAHELAAALLPEPSASSKLLAEEFGIEYDEGAEGIDGVPSGTYDDSAPQFQEEDAPMGMGMGSADSLAAQLNGAAAHPHPRSPLHPAHPTQTQDAPPDFDPDFRSPVSSPTRHPRRQPEQDPMAILAADLEYTETFLAQLRHLDAGEPAATLERLASDMIRHINDAAREREGQLRALLECEREFRKIAGEVGGTDALAALPELEDMITDDVPPAPPRAAVVAEKQVEVGPEDAHASTDWEGDLDRARLGDEEEQEEQDEYELGYSPGPTPVKTEFPTALPPSGPATAATAIPHLAHLRTFTAATATSLATISEHTQVNAAATTEAGRKIRALKNKLGGWRTEWDSAERSRVRIERWEAGIVDGDATPAAGSVSPPRAQRRVDGRKLVQEHLQAFEKALMEANTKTQAIIAAVS